MFVERDSIKSGRATGFIHSTATDFNRSGIDRPGVIRSKVGSARMQAMLYFRLKEGKLK
jgi:hypothetical protein